MKGRVLEALEAVLNDWNKAREERNELIKCLGEIQNELAVIAVYDQPKYEDLHRAAIKAYQLAFRANNLIRKRIHDAYDPD
jgi:hypothetical protein